MLKRKKGFRVKLKNIRVILLKEFYIADIMIKLLHFDLIFVKNPSCELS
jgi:hypothetical protein